jgi:integrase
VAEKLLTDRQCKAARAKTGVHYKADGNGLRLLIRPDGAKYWMLRYTIGGKESTAGLGVYPETSLEEAREKAAAARRLIAEGIHPSVERKVRIAQNIERQQATFGAIAAEWLAHNKAEWSLHHHERNEGLLRRILLPKLENLPITDVSEPLLLSVLREHYDAGIKESARRARGVAQQIFAYAKDTHRATHNPARELVGSSVLKKPPVIPFAAIKATQVGAMLRKLHESQTEPATSAALLLMLHTGVRDFALRAAKWNEIDLRAGIWTLPEARRKTRKSYPGDHLLPLPKQAVVLLKDLAKLTRTSPDAYVFASHGKAGFLAENTLRYTLHRLGYIVTAHGVRSLITDVLNERGFNADAIERQLDHAQENKARAAYLRSDWLDYRRKMMQWFADWMDAERERHTEPELPDNVVMFKRGA